MASKRLHNPVSDQRRVGHPLLDLDPVLLIASLAIGVLLTALFVPAQIWGGVL
jgi:hypothetical protein